MKSVGVLAVGVAVFFWALAGGSARAYPPVDKPQPFYMGVYMYEYQMARVAKEQGVEFDAFLEEHLKNLQAHGVNAIYLGGASQQKFPAELALFKKYGIRVIPQLDFAYFQPSWDDKALESYAKTAAAFINQYADDPDIIAFSVREEVPQNAINGLSRYYAAILSMAPKARFQLINNNLGAPTYLAVPDPAIMGTDRYAFWWEFSGGGYLASPTFALNWTREQSERYYQQSAKRGAEFCLVVTQGGMIAPGLANKFGGDGPITYPPTPKEQEQIRARIHRLAADGRMGWKQFDTPKGRRYDVWHYYRLPGNCMRALAWTGVLTGAKSFYVYSYQPSDKKTAAMTFESAASMDNPPSEHDWFTLAGRKGLDNPQFDEFAQAGKEIRRFEGIITRMERTNQTLIQCDQKGIFHNAFMLPTMHGRIVVVQNSNVGTWPANSARFFKESDDVRIDDNANLVGYKAFTEPMQVHFKLTTPAEGATGVYDLSTGKKLSASDGAYQVPVGPGSGTLIFIGSPQEAAAVGKL